MYKKNYLSIFCLLCIIIFLLQSCGQSPQQNTENVTKTVPKASKPKVEVMNTDHVKFRKSDQSLNVLFLPFSPNIRCKPKHFDIEYKAIKKIHQLRNKYGIDIQVKLVLDEECPFKRQTAVDIAKKNNADVVVWGIFDRNTKKTRIVYALVSDLFQTNTGVVALMDLKNGYYLETGNEDYIPYWALGLAEVYHKHYKVALQLFNRIRPEKCDKNVMPLVIHSFYNLEELDQMMGIITDFVKCVPPYVSYAIRGWGYMLIQELPKAEEDLTKAIELRANYLSAYEHRGGVYDLLNRDDRALKDYNKSVELGGEKNEIPYISRGLLYYNRNYQDKALLDFDKAIAINPDNAFAYSNRGNVYFHKKQYDKAIKDFTESITLIKNNPDFYKNRALAYTMIEQYDGAVDDFTRALKLNNRETNTYAHRAMAHARKGDYDEARKDFETALKLEPENELALKGQSNLRKFMEGQTELKKEHDKKEKAKELETDLSKMLEAEDKKQKILK